MKTIYFIAILLCTANAKAQTDACIAFDKLNTQIRDQKISHTEALGQIAALTPKIDAYYYERTPNQQTGAWVFPLKGYSITAVGGRNGNGYIAGGYDFLDGNKHGGHPAHDIFINDANKDCLDDKSKTPVEVLSCTEGIVVATETNWQPGNEQRGGNYILIYAPAQNRLLYYAHNKKVMVKPGDIVSAGAIIAIVGRSGANAWKQRSPTHLHFMVLKLNGNIPMPENPYELLKKARTAL